MTERPILFSAPMVRAILEGRKTQTRRALKHQPIDIIPMPKDPGQWVTLEQKEPEPKGKVCRCRYGMVGDQLWVRETWQHAPQLYCSCPQPSEASPCDDWSEGTGCRSNRGSVVYRADDAKVQRWRPAIHMPRWASRINLRISGVRVERLQAISEDDARAEGVLFVPGHGEITPQELASDPGYSNYLNCRLGFWELWESINGKDSWETNPWVWVIEFQRVTHAVSKDP